jgi:hypothetical protein
MTANHYNVGSAPNSIAAGDFNADGHQDLAVTNFNGNDVSILIGNGDGSFAAPVNYTTGISPSAVAIGDFNGDGQADLVVSNYGNSSVSVFVGSGNGAFNPAQNTYAGD